MTALATPAAQTSTTATRIGSVAGLVVGTGVANVAIAAALVAAFDISSDFEALQAGAIGGATVIGLLVGVGLFLALRRFRPAAADRWYRVAVIGGGVVSLAGPLPMLGQDATTVVGWSTAAVWALAATHVLPTVAALAVPRLLRR